MATPSNTPAYVIAYGRVCVDHDRTPSIYLRDEAVYFGGITHTLAEAEQVCRDIVNDHRVKHPVGSTILPRFVKSEDGHVPNAMCEIQEKLEQIVERMNEADEIITHTRAYRR